MKEIFLVIILFLSSCQTLRQEEGSISKQIDLIQDIVSNPNLDPITQSRLKIALENIRSTEKAKDKDILKAIDESLNSKKIALEKTDKAGKWEGARNILILIGILIGAILAFHFYAKSKIPFLN